MNAGWYISKWLNKLVNTKGKNGAIKKVAVYVGSSLAATLVSAAVKGATTKLVSLAGGKIGALAGPIGVAAGTLAGLL